MNEKITAQEKTDPEQKKLAALLKQSLRRANLELDRDLWPKMLHRLDGGARNRSWFADLFSPAALASVPWFDWVLLAAVIIGVCIFPRSIPVWLYQF
jgi:hypothetical protein